MYTASHRHRSFTRFYGICGLILTFTVAQPLAAQQSLNLDGFSLKKGSLFRTSGGISANSVYTVGGANGTLPFSYFINGSVNLTIANVIDLPFAFNLTNAGGNFNYPVAPNRFAINPTYKRVTAHLGDVILSYSPYTLGGVQVRGAGFDLAPGKRGNFSASIMAGQLQKPIAYDSTNLIAPAAYRRFGYGGRFLYSKNNYRFGMTAFSARDNAASIGPVPDSLNIRPQQNLAVSFIGSVMPIKDLEISGEYAVSALTRDLRDTSKVTNRPQNFLAQFLPYRNSTSFYKAMKLNLNYRYKQSTIGLGFERVDPGYQTLGILFMNNDLQNITVNFSQSFFKGLGQVSANVGYQRDDLDGRKMGANKRNVVAVNASLTPTKKLYLTGSFSNFSTFLNLKPQMQVVNQISVLVDMDSLNYSQVSRNMNIMANYMIRQDKQRVQSLNANLSVMDVKDVQGGAMKNGGPTRLYNFGAAYTMQFVPRNFSFTAAFNGALNRMAGQEISIFGPTFSARTQLWKKVSAMLACSYNQTKQKEVSTVSVLTNRFTMSYALKGKHSFNMTALQQFRRQTVLNPQGGNQRPPSNMFVVNMGYNFRF